MLELGKKGPILVLSRQKTEMECRSSVHARRTDALIGVFLYARPGVMATGSGGPTGPAVFLAGRSSTPIRCASRVVEGTGSANLKATRKEDFSCPQMNSLSLFLRFQNPKKTKRFRARSVYRCLSNCVKRLMHWMTHPKSTKSSVKLSRCTRLSRSLQILVSNFRSVSIWVRRNFHPIYAGLQRHV